MRLRIDSVWQRSAVIALALGLLGGSASAQDPTPRPERRLLRPTTPVPPPLVGERASAGAAAPPRVASPRAGQLSPTPSPEVRRVQATPHDVPPTPPATAEGSPLPGPGGTSADIENLKVPASEREGGGREPTIAEAEAEKEEEAKLEPAFLTKVLGLEDSPVRIFGWIQNSFTGNANGRPPSGENFGVNPNHRANQWMGNQYYLVAENPLEQNDKVNFGFRVDSLFGNDWQFNKMYGLFDEAFNLNQFSGFDLAQFYGEVHLPVLTKGGVDVRGGRFYTLAGYEWCRRSAGRCCRSPTCSTTASRSPTSGS